MTAEITIKSGNKLVAEFVNFIELFSLPFYVAIGASTYTNQVKIRCLT